MKLLHRFVISSLLPLLALTGCSGKPKEDNSKQTITINITSDPQTLDPRKVRSLNDVNLMGMFMEGLTRIDNHDAVQLALAERIDTSNDLTTYTIQLREAYWSNGDPITAQDFAYTWKKTLSPQFNAPNANLLYVIKNAKEVKDGKLPASLLGIETPNPRTLVVKLNHPVPYFSQLMSNPASFPVNAKVDSENPNWAEQPSSYVCSGPFKPVTWKHQSLLEAEKNVLYWDRHVVSLTDIKMIMVSEETGFHMFENKELHWEGSPFSTIPVDAISSLSQNKTMNIQPNLGTMWIRINTIHPIFQSKKVRRALGISVDREAITTHVTQGGQIPATGILPPSICLKDEPYFKDGQREEAKALFEEGLAELGLSRESLPEVKLTYVAADRPHRVAQALQSQWSEALDMKVSLEAIERKVYFERISRKDYTLSIGSWIGDVEDPLTFLEVFKTKDVGTNNTNWENACYTDLLETSNLCTTTESRKEMLSQSEQIIIDEMPVIPIFYYTMLYVKAPELHNAFLTSTGKIEFKWAYLGKK